MSVDFLISYYFEEGYYEQSPAMPEVDFGKELGCKQRVNLFLRQFSVKLPVYYKEVCKYESFEKYISVFHINCVY